ncbi:MAG: DUF4382 domain-containing protein [SAR202 cluster bacterium]|nr:DUF4382 domain-containing protein [SAR202 cluster bacterium]
MGVLAVILAACGDGGDETTPTATEAATAATVATATPPATSAPAAATAAPTRAAAVPTVTPRPSTSSPSPSPTSAPAKTGEIQVRVTDAPPEGVSAVWVTVANIEVQKADADEEGEAGWVSLIVEEQRFDLVAVTGVEEVLGTIEFELGQ